MRLAPPPNPAVPLLPLTAGLGLGLALGGLAGVTLMGILPYVGGSLGTSDDHAMWVVTYFIVHWALGIALMPWLARRFGEKGLFLLCMALLAGGSVLAIIADDLPLMLAARALQGISAGILVPLVQALFLHHYPKSRHGLAIALWSNLMLGPFFIGPALGGWLATHASWRDIFWAAVPLAFLAAAIVRATLPDVRPQRPAPPFDLPGFLLLYGGLLSLQVVLDQGEDNGWFHAAFIRHFAFVATVLLLLFVWRELSTPAPLLQLRYFRRRNYTLGLLLLSLGWAIFMAWATLLPLWAEEDLGFNGWWGGLLLAPLALAAIPLATLMDRLQGLVGLRRLAALCFLTFALAYGITDYSPAVGLAATLPSEILQGAGAGLLFVPLTMILLSGIPKEEIAVAATASNFVRVFSANLGVTLLTTLWERQTARFAGQLSAAMPPEAYGRWMGRLQEGGMSADAARVWIAHALHVESQTLAMDSVFRLSAWLCLGAAALAWFAIQPPKKMVQAGEPHSYVEELEAEGG